MPGRNFRNPFGWNDEHMEQKENILLENAPRLSESYWPADTSEPLRDTNIGDALGDAARRWPEAIALVEYLPGGYGRRWTFAELLGEAQQVARALLARFAPGERVAIWSSNRPEWVLCEFGAALAGITLVTANPAYLAAELTYVLGQSKAAGLIVEPQVRGRDLLSIARDAQRELPALRAIVSTGAWSEFVDEGDPAVSLPEVKPGDVAQIQYTSGTTGFPKGTLLTHVGLANNGRLYAQAIGARPGDVWANPMPMFHTAGCGLATLGALQTGGTHVLPPAFDPALMLELAESARATVMLCVPTMLVRMLDEPGLTERRLESLRMVTLGGAPVSPELVQRAKARLGVEVGIGFGQTETSPYIAHTRAHERRPGWETTVGRPLPQIEVKIADPESGATVPVDTVGEIWTRSRCVTPGYFDNDAATREALTPDGWLRTGDLGSMAGDGYLSIRGRIKEMIIRGGENVYPREIEDLLLSHPSVAGAAVVGLPDREWGEIIGAFVQLRPGTAATARELDAFCRKSLAAYKTPRMWRFVERLPMTASGKIQKFVLRNAYLSEARRH